LVEKASYLINGELFWSMKLLSFWFFWVFPTVAPPSLPPYICYITGKFSGGYWLLS